MVITKTPVRISLVGGGSDQPAFLQHDGGAVVSFTISPSIYIGVKSHFERTWRIAYREIEEVSHVSDIKHELVRGTLEAYNIREPLEIWSTADIPAGTGLGSSSAFMVGLIHALRAFRQHNTEPWVLAHDAHNVEGFHCRKPVGYQDHFAAACGGLALYTFTSGGIKEVHPIKTSGVVPKLQKNLLLLWTGITRDANPILKQQQEALDFRDSRARASVRAMANLAFDLAFDLNNGDVDSVGDVLRTAWSLKKALPGVCDDRIDDWFKRAERAVHPVKIGGKLLGAGGGGCILFYAPPETHESIVQATGLRPIPFTITKEGSKLVYSS